MLLNCLPGVLPRTRVEPEEGGEEREHAAEDEEEGHEKEVDRDDLEEVNTVEAHEAGTDAHEEEAGHEEGEVDDHVHVAPAVRTGEHVSVLHYGSLKSQKKDALNWTELCFLLVIFLCLRA